MFMKNPSNRESSPPKIPTTWYGRLWKSLMDRLSTFWRFITQSFRGKAKEATIEKPIEEPVENAIEQPLSSTPPTPTPPAPEHSVEEQAAAQRQKEAEAQKRADEEAQKAREAAEAAAKETADRVAAEREAERQKQQQEEAARQQEAQRAQEAAEAAAKEAADRVTAEREAERQKQQQQEEAARQQEAQRAQEAANAAAKPEEPQPRNASEEAQGPDAEQLKLEEAERIAREQESAEIENARKRDAQQKANEEKRIREEQAHNAKIKNMELKTEARTLQGQVTQFLNYSPIRDLIPEVDKQSLRARIQAVENLTEDKSDDQIDYVSLRAQVTALSETRTQILTSKWVQNLQQEFTKTAQALLDSIPVVEGKRTYKVRGVGELVTAVHTSNLENIVKFFPLALANVFATQNPSLSDVLDEPKWDAARKEIRTRVQKLEEDIKAKFPIPSENPEVISLYVQLHVLGDLVYILDYIPLVERQIATVRQLANFPPETAPSNTPPNPAPTTSTQQPAAAQDASKENAAEKAIEKRTKTLLENITTLFKSHLALSIPTDEYSRLDSIAHALKDFNKAKTEMDSSSLNKMIDEGESLCNKNSAWLTKIEKKIREIGKSLKNDFPNNSLTELLAQDIPEAMPIYTGPKSFSTEETASLKEAARELIRSTRFKLTPSDDIDMISLYANLEILAHLNAPHAIRLQMDIIEQSKRALKIEDATPPPLSAADTAMIQKFKDLALKVETQAVDMVNWSKTLQPGPNIENTKSNIKEAQETITIFRNMIHGDQHLLLSMLPLTIQSKLESNLNNIPKSMGQLKEQPSYSLIVVLDIRDLKEIITIMEILRDANIIAKQSKITPDQISRLINGIESTFNEKNFKAMLTKAAELKSMYEAFGNSLKNPQSTTSTLQSASLSVMSGAEKDALKKAANAAVTKTETLLDSAYFAVAPEKAPLESKNKALSSELKKIEIDYNSLNNLTFEINAIHERNSKWLPIIEREIFEIANSLLKQINPEVSPNMKHLHKDTTESITGKKRDTLNLYIPSMLSAIYPTLKKLSEEDRKKLKSQAEDLIKDIQSTVPPTEHKIYAQLLIFQTVVIMRSDQTAAIEAQMKVVKDLKAEFASKAVSKPKMGRDQEANAELAEHSAALDMLKATSASSEPTPAAPPATVTPPPLVLPQAKTLLDKFTEVQSFPADERSDELDRFLSIWIPSSDADRIAKLDRELEAHLAIVHRKRELKQRIATLSTKMVGWETYADFYFLNSVSMKKKIDESLRKNPYRSMSEETLAGLEKNVQALADKIGLSFTPRKSSKP